MKTYRLTRVKCHFSFYVVFVTLLTVLSCAGHYKLQADSLPGNSTNLVLHHPYDYWPLPNYGLTKDEGDSTQLTDGQTAAMDSTPLWRRKSTVGWALPLNDPAVIWFDLGQVCSLQELRMDTTSGNSGSGVVDIGLRVFTSLDNKTYYLAGQQPAPVPGTPAPVTNGRQLSVALNGRQARYVAVAAMAPAPYYFVFTDEIEIWGTAAHQAAVAPPVEESITAVGAQGLQQALSGSLRSSQLMTHLLAPVAAQLDEWPSALAAQQKQEMAQLQQECLKAPGNYEKLRAEATEGHRVLARQVYGADSLVWEIPPDAAFGPLTLPAQLKPAQSASIDTVVNALEATALGAVNLSPNELPLKVSITGNPAGAPVLKVRIAHFFATTNGRYVPDALLATDGPRAIPSGEAAMIWIEALSAQARPGDYHYELTVSVGDEEHTLPLTVRVHDVTLSDSTPLATQDWSYFNTGNNLPIYQELCEAMLKHRVTVAMNSLGALPLPARDAQGRVIRPLRLDFTALDKTLELDKDFAQVGFYLPFSTVTPNPSDDWFGTAPWMSDEYQSIFTEWLTACIAHLKSRGWGYNRFFFQNFDETLDPKVAQVCRLMHRIDPQVRTMSTIPEATAEATREFVNAGMNIFCYNAPRVTYDNAPDGFPVLTSDGRELWFYGAADSAFGDGKERDPLGFYRLMFWKAFQDGATGVGFWDMVINNGHSPVWTPENQDQVYYPQVYINAAGFPPPPPEIQTAESIIPSRRWEYQRMGTEDYMLLKSTQDKIKTLGATGAPYQARLDEIVKTVLTQGNDKTLFRQQRVRLVDLAASVLASVNRRQLPQGGAHHLAAF